MSSRDRILVTPRSVTKSGHPALRRLANAGFSVELGPAGRQPSEEELLRQLPGCVGYLAGVEPVTARVLAAAPGLRAISRNGTGVDNIDEEAARRAGVAVLRAEGANARGVAELTVALMLALARQVPAADAALKRGVWTRPSGIELEGRTLGLIGCGRIGRMVAQLAAAFGMQVLAHDELAARQPLPGGVARFATLREVLQAADFLSLHCPPLPEGRALLTAEALAELRAGAFIINTARFDLLDPPAMLDALATGRVAGLALDVFAEEPPRDLALVQHPRVITTPHLGGFTGASVDRAMHAAVDNLLQALTSGRT